MSSINSFSERNRGFEETPFPSQELMDYQLQSLKFYLRKWMMVILIILLVILGFSFMYFNYEFSLLRKTVDYRYFLMEELMEDIHNVKIERGRVVREYSNSSVKAPNSP